ncbi:MAG: HAD family hydrolase [Odoribacter sp.]|nr:HAD family hydrolase [Odoribacter sp.]
MINLIIFDLDGTLLDTIDDLTDAMNYALKEYGYQGYFADDYCNMIGEGVTKLVERALPENARDEDTIRQVKAEFLTYYGAHMTDKTSPFAGICQVLENLRRQGKILAVASNKFQDAARELIRYFFENGTFTVIRGERQEIPPKPNPAILLEIMNMSGSDSENTIFIGDSRIDIETAKNGGIKSIGVS